MSIIRRMRKQKAIWWDRLDPDKYGKFAYDAPLEIDCRWDDSSHEYRNEIGEKAFSQSTVYPDRVMKTGDKLKRGDIESDTPTDPTSVEGVYEIQRFEQIPNLRNTEILFIAHLGMRQMNR